MNRSIGEFLKNSIQELDLVDKLGGIVTTISKNKATDKGKGVIKFTSYFDSDKLEYIDFTPDSKYKSMCFLEDFGTEIVDARQNKFTSTIRINVWNNKVEGGTEAELIIAKLIKHFWNITSDFDNKLDNIIIQPKEVISNNNGLFSRYSFDDTTKQYLMYPYEALGIVLKASYNLNLSC